MKTRMVKLRRGNPCVAVLENDTWVPLKLLTEDVLADCSIPPQATESVIAFLSLDERQRAELAKRLTSVWPQAERLQNEMMHPVMPFQPLSCRDFMLYERHAIDAARGYAAFSRWRTAWPACTRWRRADRSRRFGRGCCGTRSPSTIWAIT